MSKNNLIDQIFDEWKVSLTTDKLKTTNVSDNFEQLFQKWHDAGATKDDLYDNMLPRAIQAHQPSKSTIKKTYARLKHIQKKSEQEFSEAWIKEIHDRAKEAFFEYFPIELDKKKIYGNLGKREYMFQRRLAEQYPILDTTELEKRLLDDDIELYLEDLKKALLNGGQNE